MEVVAKHAKSSDVRTNVSIRPTEIVADFVFRSYSYIPFLLFSTIKPISESSNVILLLAARKHYLCLVSGVVAEACISYAPMLRARG